jgi:hypothetical protein
MGRSLGGKEFALAAGREMAEGRDSMASREGNKKKAAGRAGEIAARRARK